MSKYKRQTAVQLIHTELTYGRFFYFSIPMFLSFPLVLL